MRSSYEVFIALAKPDLNTAVAEHNLNKQRHLVKTDDHVG